MGTVIRKQRQITFSAVDATPLDGSTASRTYKFSDMTTGATVVLSEATDAVSITMSGKGSDGNSAVFTLWGYPDEGPAERIYHTVTAVLGAGVAGTGELFVDQISGTDTHYTTIAIKDNAANSDTIAKIALDTVGYRHLMFEPTTFTTLTEITFYVREYGTY